MDWVVCFEKVEKQGVVLGMVVFQGSIEVEELGTYQEEKVEVDHWREHEDKVVEASYHGAMKLERKEEGVA